MDPPAPGGQDWQDIGTQRVSDHHRLGRTGAVAGEDLSVGHFGLVRDDFDGIEQRAQPRLRQFAFLVQKVALGQQN